MYRSILFGALGASFVLSAAMAAEPTFKGFVFVPRAEDVRAGGVPDPAGHVDVARVPALATAAADAEIRRYIGLPIANITLESIRSAIAKQYAAIGRPFVYVSIPKQDVTDGVVQVVVVEGHVGPLALEGNRWFGANQYLNNLHLQPGGLIDNNVMQADLDWINRNQYRHATMLAGEGATVGTTKLLLRTEERFPVSITAGGDNTGNQGTGLYRMYTGIDWGNALWRGDDFNYRFTTTPEIRPLSQHAFSYTADTPWRDTLTLSLSIVNSTSLNNGGPTGTTGHTVNAGLRYQMPLPAWEKINHSLTVGYDFKSTNNNILFGGVSVFPTTTEIDQFVVSYGANRPDSLGSTSLTLQFFGSPGNLSALNNTATFRTQQANATADYVYGNASLERLTTLVEPVPWFLRATLQLSSATLLPSEQMSFGGVTNRGFATSSTTRDNGFQLTNELRAPTLGAAAMRAWGLNSEQHQFVPFVFVDYGAGWNNAPNNTARMTMVTVGPGFTYQFGRYMSVRFTFGFPVRQSGQTGPELRPQFSANATF